MSRHQARAQAATREYTTTCSTCGRVIAHGRVKGRSEARLNADNAAAITAHVTKCQTARQVRTAQDDRGDAPSEQEASSE